MTCPCPCRKAIERTAWPASLRRVKEIDGLPSTNMNFLGDAKRYEKIFHEAIRALPPCGRCDTHVMVPREPTKEMIDVADAVIESRDQYIADLADDIHLARLVYRAMLNAAKEGEK